MSRSDRAWSGSCAVVRAIMRGKGRPTQYGAPEARDRLGGGRRMAHSLLRLSFRRPATTWDQSHRKVFVARRTEPLRVGRARAGIDRRRGAGGDRRPDAGRSALRRHQRTARRFAFHRRRRTARPSAFRRCRSTATRQRSHPYTRIPRAQVQASRWWRRRPLELPGVGKWLRDGWLRRSAHIATSAVRCGLRSGADRRPLRPDDRAGGGVLPGHTRPGRRRHRGAGHIGGAAQIALLAGSRCRLRTAGRVRGGQDAAASVEVPGVLTWTDRRALRPADHARRDPVRAGVSAFGQRRRRCADGARPDARIAGTTSSRPKSSGASSDRPSSSRREASCREASSDQAARSDPLRPWEWDWNHHPTHPWIEHVRQALARGEREQACARVTGVTGAAGDGIARRGDCRDRLCARPHTCATGKTDGPTSAAAGVLPGGRRSGRIT